MSVKLEAPYPQIETISLLPNPQVGDVQRRVHSMEPGRSMNGKLYTYVVSHNHQALTYSFVLTRMKAAELEEFIAFYFDSEIRLTNHKDEVWIGKLVNNPFEFGAQGRAAGWPGGESITITLEFEGIKL